ncbi:hypothetical protein ASE86_14455 [Sphingomonas sp. Leaf33]|uniref:hypothetical protein n=1 Tax=Sphingomonas sp. Leaf33 TaxID=1736215 RepID=UPI0006F46F21|nr:hypothetical protein [Sphingomonas sp. Leaf33]KQN21424.1 hypothetical protein ASE86_14455 [Sphingomonas sp. Leaf33]
MAVIKQAGETGPVRSLACPPPLMAVRIDPRDEAIAALVAERDTLAADLNAARAALALAETQTGEALAAAVVAARDAAYAEGRREGLAVVKTREADRVAAIARGVAEEAARFEERFALIDSLAAALARACLDRIFARPDAMAAMVTDALARHVATLRDDTVLSVRVSGTDFADTVALDEAVRTAGARATVAIDRDLPAGACRVAARLGQVDLDVPAQWDVLARLLDDMATA